MTPLLKEMCVDVNNTLSVALEALDNNAQGIIFIIEKNNFFLGVLTDGDIRRSFLKGKGYNQETKVSEIYNDKAFSLPVSSKDELIQKKLSSLISYIPLLNDQGEVVDYASKSRLHRISVLEPLLAGKELEYITECINTNWVSSQGRFVSLFEETLADFSNVPYALAVSNGTVALHLALLTLDIGPGDEVIVPDFTFASSVNAIIHAGAKPVLVDVLPDTWTIDPNCIQEAITNNTKAIIPVHIYGHPCHMDEILKISDKNGLYIIEDCAEALGAQYKGQPVGTFGDAATFSFFGNKVITTGEGGMVLFSKKDYYDKACVLRDHGMKKDLRYWHEVIGYNYRMTNMQAALGVAQMEQFDIFYKNREKNARLYFDKLKNNKFIQLQSIQNWAKSSHWLVTLLINESSPINRDKLITKLQKNGIETRPTFFSMHMMPPYQEYTIQNKYPISEKISKTGISLPSSASLIEDQIIDICDKIISFLQ